MSSMITTQTAARNYAQRPADERFGSVADLVAAAVYDREHSKEITYNAKDLRAVATGPREAHTSPTGEQPNVLIESPKGRAEFTHWAFGQMCRSVGAPASYLRELPPTLAADCLNHGLKETAAGTSFNLLVKQNGHGPVLRAATSDKYGRVWDSELYTQIQKQIVEQPGRDGAWTLPPTWSGEAAGAYRGDRDSFLVLTNGGSIVTDPSLRGSIGSGTSSPSGSGSTDAMYRGLLVRNSEVGAASVVIETILYRYICGNHMLWGAVTDKMFRRRHIGTNTARDTIREISRIAWNWTNSSASRDEAIIKGLIDHEIAHTKDAVIDELRAMGASREDAERAYDRCERTEAASPRSFWGAAQGLTRLSQEHQNQDDRYQLDQLAAKILARGAKLVRV